MTRSSDDTGQPPQEPDGPFPWLPIVVVLTVLVIGISVGLVLYFST